jgi:HEAT repeat protein
MKTTALIFVIVSFLLLLGIAMTSPNKTNAEKGVVMGPAANGTAMQLEQMHDIGTVDGETPESLSRSSGSIPHVERLPESQLTYDVLRRMLRSDDYIERYTAADNLCSATIRGWKGTKEQADELAIMALHDPYWACRYEAAKFIYSRGKLAEATIPALIQALESEEPLVRNQCVLALQRTGGTLRALGALKRMLDAGDQLDVVAPALLESSRVEGRHAVIIGAIASQNANVRMWCKAAMIKGDTMTEEYVKDVTAALKTGRKDQILNACKSVELASRNAAPAGTLLVDLLANADIDIKLAAARAIQETSPKDKVVIDALIKGLEDKDIRSQCSIALHRIGPAAKAAIPKLLDLLSKDESYALYALEGIDPKTPDALSILIRILDKSLDNKKPSEKVIAAIGAYGPAAKPAVPVLVKALHVKNDHPYHIDVAIWALGQIGPDAKEARAEVLKFSRGVFAETVEVAMKRIDAADPGKMPPPEDKYTGRTLHGDF